MNYYPSIPSTVDLQLLEHLWDHENMFESLVIEKLKEQWYLKADTYCFYLMPSVKGHMNMYKEGIHCVYIAKKVQSPQV